MNNNERIKIWEYIQKQIILKQIPEIENKIILDFGAGNCYLPSLLKDNNKIICVEPYFDSYDFLYKKDNIYQINGDLKILNSFKDESFDVIFCHNVFEYLDDNSREKIIKEFCRILKKDGILSFIKHNKYGRILEQILFKNDFTNYKSVFIENESYSERFGTISYFKERKIVDWSNKKLMQINKFGLRMFYDLQSNMELQKNKQWQDNIIDAELFFCKTEEFINIAFLHHLIYIKK